MMLNIGCATTSEYYLGCYDAHMTPPEGFESNRRQDEAQYVKFYADSRCTKLEETRYKTKEQMRGEIPR